MDKEIAIIIPAYNAHNTIKSLIYSILAQTIKDLCTIIIINDDTKEKGYSYLQEYFPNEDLVFLQTLEPQSGPAIARNLGLNYVRKHNIPYIVFADADDIFLNNLALQKMYENIQNSDLVISDFFEEIENHYQLHDDKDIWLFGKMYKNDIIVKNNIVFPNESVNEDVCFNVWYWACSEKKTWIDIPTYLWKENSNSITRKNNHNYIYTSFCPLCQNLKDTFNKMFLNSNIPLEKKQFIVANRIIRLYIAYNDFYLVQDERLNKEEILLNIKNFFKECLKEIWETVPQQTIFNAWKELGLENYFVDVIPNIGFYDFIKKIREE